MMYLLLIMGFFLLVKGADVFVDGSSSVAKNLHVPAIIIGLTVVAFGASCPEAAVSITASIQRQNGISLGNVIGSNFFSLMVVAGLSAILLYRQHEPDQLHCRKYEGWVCGMYRTCRPAWRGLCFHI